MLQVVISANAPQKAVGAGTGSSAGSDGESLAGLGQEDFSAVLANQIKDAIALQRAAEGEVPGNGQTRHGSDIGAALRGSLKDSPWAGAGAGLVAEASARLEGTLALEPGTDADAGSKTFKKSGPGTSGEVQAKDQSAPVNPLVDMMALVPTSPLVPAMPQDASAIPVSGQFQAPSSVDEARVDMPDRPMRAASALRSDGRTLAASEFSGGDRNLPTTANFSVDGGKSLPATQPEKLEPVTGMGDATATLAPRIDQSAVQVDGNATLQVRSDGMMAANTVAGPAQQVPKATVVPHVGTPEWGGAVGDKVVWMANQNHQVAELHLNPPNLGPVEVRLTISQDQASAMFVAHHSAVRDAIETALPTLREMLADSGIMLGNATVSAESFGHQQQAGGEAGSGRNSGGNDGGAVRQAAVSTMGEGGGRRSLLDGMVDTFA
jgi:flagellar hook-length control protein FliK